MEEESRQLLIIVLALVLHLGAVFLGYIFHRWLLEKTSTTSSWTSWWNKQTAVYNEDVSTSSLSNRQLAFLQTFCLWLMVVGLVARWRPEILLIVLVGLILLMRSYPNDGRIPENQVYLAVFGYIAWLIILATTTALLLWPCRMRFDMGEELEEEYLQTVAIGGAIATAIVLALALIVFCVKRRRIIQDAGNCMDSSLV